MVKEIFHTIRACGKTFDEDEWSEYCDETRNDETKRIFNTFGKYTFNDCDVCINPDVVDLSIKNGAWGYYVHIKYAECGNGIWTFGLDYSTGTGGGGFSPAWSDKVNDPKSWHSGFASQKECLLAACDKALIYLGNAYDVKEDNRGVLIGKLKQMVLDYKKGLERPKVVQLELF